MRSSKQGISLMTLIITVVIAIILASISIMSSRGTVEKTNYTKFVSEFADFQTAADHDYLSRVEKASPSATPLNDDEIYYMMSKGYQHDDVYMANAPGDIIPELEQLEFFPGNLKGTKYFRINKDTNIKNWELDKQYTNGIEKHYITNKGEVFMLPGYMFEEEGEIRYYVNSKKYYVGEPIVVLPDVEAEEISLARYPNGYFDGDVTVSLFHGNIPAGFELQYKVGRADWTSGNRAVLTSNATVFARLYETSTHRETALSYIVVDNIDKKDPLPPTSMQKIVERNAISVRAFGGVDKGSGIVGYQYSLDNINWTATVPEDHTHRFSGLSANTDYTIYAKAVDGVARKSIAFTDEVTTEQ